MNDTFIKLTVPALCYSLLLTIFPVVKASFNSWTYFRSTESLLLIVNAALCVSLFVHSLNFDQTDRYIRFTRRFTNGLCRIELIVIAAWTVSLTVQRLHKVRKHEPDFAYRDRRLAELHRTFRDIRLARYGGLTHFPESKDSPEFGDGCVYFPRDKLSAEKSLSRPQLKTYECQMFPRFLRCSCCINDSCITCPKSIGYDSEQSANNFPERLKHRLNVRSKFLAHTVSRSSSLNTDEPTSAVNPHLLCNVCLWICCSSSILQARDALNPIRHFSPHIRERECFEHYSIPQMLFDSAKNGCHLCTLIMSSMSPEQHQSLFDTDSTLEDQRRRALEEASEDGGKQAIEEKYRRLRRVRLTIETFDGDIQPRDSQLKNVHSLEISKGGAQIVPHFGKFHRPRRWMRCIRDFEKHMLVEDGELEFAPPILILQSRLKEQHPIRMPISNNTGSGYSMALIRRWLMDTEGSFQIGTFLPGRVIHVDSALKVGIIRVLEKDEIMARVYATVFGEGESPWAEECKHKFAMGCLNTSSHKCCTCSSQGSVSTQRQLDLRKELYSSCPRCKGEHTCPINQDNITDVNTQNTGSMEVPINIKCLTSISPQVQRVRSTLL